MGLKWYNLDKWFCGFPPCLKLAIKCRVTAGFTGVQLEVTNQRGYFTRTAYTHNPPESESNIGIFSWLRDGDVHVLDKVRTNCSPPRASPTSAQPLQNDLARTDTFLPPLASAQGPGRSWAGCGAGEAFFVLMGKVRTNCSPPRASPTSAQPPQNDLARTDTFSFRLLLAFLLRGQGGVGRGAVDNFSYYWTR